MSTATLVVAQSKPEAISALRATWRKSAEHKAAQVKRFLYALGAVLAANLVPEVIAGKNPLAHFTDLRTAWYYVIPFAYVTWKQAHPSMSASEVDSAPGATIVPDQVGLPADPVPAPLDTGLQPAPLDTGLQPAPIATPIATPIEVTPADENIDLDAIPEDVPVSSEA